MLPDNDMSWPPKALSNVLTRMDEWGAWYSGDPEELQAVYQYNSSAKTAPRTRPSQYQGGLVGRAARMFWGPPRVGETVGTRLHVPIASDICQASSDLLFADPPQLSSESGDAVNKVLDDYLAKGLIASLVDGAETCAALGGTYLRVTWDEQLMKQPFVTSVDADGAWPEFLYGRLRGVTFWWVVWQDGHRRLRHLEYHGLDNAGNGFIQHGLYMGTPDKLGTARPLEDHESTAGLARQVNADSVITTNSPGLCVVYVPNRMPNAVWRKDPLGRNLGQSDFAKCEPLMDKLDQTYSNWMRDLDKAKGRIIAPGYMLDVNGPGQGVDFSIDREVFTTVNAPPGSSGINELKVVQFSFDANRYMQTAQQLVEDILRRSGYSAQTFGEEEGGNATTATEVTSRDRRSALTRSRKIREWDPALEQLLTKMLHIHRERFGASIPTDVDVSVKFNTTAQETPIQLATTAEALQRAGAASLQTLVAMVHPDWDDRLVQEELTRINQDGALADPDDPGMGRGNANVTE